MYINRKIRNATPVEYKGIKFRSKLEKSCYDILEKSGIEFKYEPFEVELIPAFSYLGKHMRAWTYTPDFVVFHNIIIEIKGFPNDVWGYKKKMILKWIVDNNYQYEFYEVRNQKQLEILINELKNRNICEQT